MSVPDSNTLSWIIAAIWNLKMTLFQTISRTLRWSVAPAKNPGREVSKKSAFPTSFDLSTVFKRTLWMWTSSQNDQSLTSVFLCHVNDRSVSFPNCNRKSRITNKTCSWREFKHCLILRVALQELTFQVFESRNLHGVLIGILRCLYLLCEYYLIVRLM